MRSIKSDARNVTSDRKRENGSKSRLWKRTLSRKREGKFDDHFALRQESWIQWAPRCSGKGKEKFDDDFSPRQDLIFMQQQMQLIQSCFPGFRAGCKSSSIGFAIKF